MPSLYAMCAAALITKQAPAIPGAVSHDPEQFDALASPLHQDKPAAICGARSGPVSKSAHEAPAQKGFDVRCLESGLAVWDTSKT